MSLPVLGMQETRVIKPCRKFEGHTEGVRGVVHLPGGQRILTCSWDGSLRVWGLHSGSQIETWRDAHPAVNDIALSPDGKKVVSVGEGTSMTLWNTDSGKVVAEWTGHVRGIVSVCWNGDGGRVVSGSYDGTARVWDVGSGKTVLAINPRFEYLGVVSYSPDSTMIATGGLGGLKIWDEKTAKLIANLKGYTAAGTVYCVVWTMDGTTLVSASEDHSIIMWNTNTWGRIVVLPTGHTQSVKAIAISPNGHILASASRDGTAQLWNLEGGLPDVMISSPLRLEHTGEVECVSFSTDGKLLATGSWDKNAYLWDTSAIIRQTSLGEPLLDLHDGDKALLQADTTRGPGQQRENKHRLPPGFFDDVAPYPSRWHSPPLSSPRQNHVVRHLPSHRRALLGGISSYNTHDTPIRPRLLEWARNRFHNSPNRRNGTGIDKTQDSRSKIITISPTILSACITGDLPMAEDLLTQEINNDADSYNSYANRSFLMARKLNWDRALYDALQSISIQPSLIGCISKGIGLCGKRNFQDATKAFDLAFMFADGDSKTTNLLLLIKAIALFNANQHDEAMVRIQELATACPNADIVACRIVEAYLHVQLGINTLDHKEAAAHFTAAVENCLFPSIHSTYEVFVVLFGWDLKSLWKTANQKRCHAFLRAGRITEALESYRYMMDMSDEATKACCLNWSTGFKQDCEAFYAANGDTAPVVSTEPYPAAADPDPESDTIFADRCKDKLARALWEEALLDAQKVIELNPSSPLGYRLENAALHCTKHWDEAYEDVRIVLSKLETTPDAQTQELHHVSSSEVEGAIREVVNTQLENTPLRLLNTFTGRLFDRETQTNAFKASIEYEKLLSSTTKLADFRVERIQDVVITYFRYVTLSHRWSGKEPLLQDIQDKAIYDLDPVGSVTKLQSFCKTARDAGYRWAWSDTCCIDKNNHPEVQESVNSMFAWYSRSALTIVYLSDVMPLSTAGALARSDWNRRGWTVQEFLAPRIILFFQKDWTLYLNDRSPNHKNSIAIMQELGYATGIDVQALVTFRPGVEGARKKLQWASMRVTTLQEDIAYSLFGIFGVHLPVIYGEKGQNALGRLLQEIVTRSGDISVLDWVGKPSEFNSCLPAEIGSYRPLPYTSSSLSEDLIEAAASSLRNTVAVDLASGLYNLLSSLGSPRFASRRLHLPCLTFPVTEVRWRDDRDQEIPINAIYAYEVKAKGLHDLLLLTEEQLPTWQTLLLVYPWDHCLLELPSSAPTVRDAQDYSVARSLGKNERVGSGSRWRASQLISRLRQRDSESHWRALRLIVRLRQPFTALLLARQRGGEYKRIATNQVITAQVQDMASVRKMVDSIRSSIRTVEIL